MTNRSPTRPWIIWVENFRPHTLMLLVYKPKHNTFLKWNNRWRRTLLMHQDGPIYFASDREQAEWIQVMIEAGVTALPDPETTPYRVAMSLADVKEIVEDSWKP